MEQRQLQAFLAVATVLDFETAARKLRRPREDLRRDLDRLEAALGCSLLRERSGKLLLTGPGAVFLPRAEGLLANAGPRSHRGRAKVRTVQPAARWLRIACTPETDWDPPLELAQKNYFHQGSERQLRVAVLPADDVLQQLRRRRIDLALMAEVDLVCRIEFHVRRIQVRAGPAGRTKARRPRTLVRYAVWRHQTELAEFLAEWVGGLEPAASP